MFRARPRFRRLSSGQLTRRINLPLSSVAQVRDGRPRSAQRARTVPVKLRTLALLKLSPFEAQQLCRNPSGVLAPTTARP